MTVITLPPDIEAWARAEVAAGRAESVEHAAQKAIASYRSQMDSLRRSLDEAEAEAERDGWLDADAVFAELKARYAVDR
jgi:hypothetical protein